MSFRSVGVSEAAPQLTPSRQASLQKPPASGKLSSLNSENALERFCRWIKPDVCQEIVKNEVIHLRALAQKDQESIDCSLSSSQVAFLLDCFENYPSSDAWSLFDAIFFKIIKITQEIKQSLGGQEALLQILKKDMYRQIAYLSCLESYAFSPDYADELDLDFHLNLDIVYWELGNHLENLKKACISLASDKPKTKLSIKASQRLLEIKTKQYIPIDKLKAEFCRCIEFVKEFLSDKRTRKDQLKKLFVDYFSHYVGLSTPYTYEDWCGDLDRHKLVYEIRYDFQLSYIEPLFLESLPQQLDKKISEKSEGSTWIKQLLEDLCLTFYTELYKYKELYLEAEQTIEKFAKQEISLKTVCASINWPYEQIKKLSHSNILFKLKAMKEELIFWQTHHQTAVEHIFSLTSVANGFPSKNAKTVYVGSDFFVLLLLRAIAFSPLAISENKAMETGDKTVDYFFACLCQEINKEDWGASALEALNWFKEVPDESLWSNKQLWCNIAQMANIYTHIKNMSLKPSDRESIEALYKKVFVETETYLKTIEHSRAVEIVNKILEQMPREGFSEKHAALIRTELICDYFQSDFHVFNPRVDHGSTVLAYPTFISWFEKLRDDLQKQEVEDCADFLPVKEVLHYQLESLAELPKNQSTEQKLSSPAAFKLATEYTSLDQGNLMADREEKNELTDRNERREKSLAKTFEEDKETLTANDRKWFLAQMRNPRRARAFLEKAGFLIERTRGSHKLMRSEQSSLTLATHSRKELSARARNRFLRTFLEEMSQQKEES